MQPPRDVWSGVPAPDDDAHPHPPVLLLPRLPTGHDLPAPHAGGRCPGRSERRPSGRHGLHVRPHPGLQTGRYVHDRYVQLSTSNLLFLKVKNRSAK